MSTQISIQKKVSFVFSAQQIVDCDTYDGGCNGGWPSNVFDYATYNYVTNNATYPYTAKQTGSCNSNAVKSANAPYKVATYRIVPYNCASMLLQIKKTPMVVALDGKALKSYKSGIFNGNATAVSHAVLLVGVDSCDNWIIQNSWGATWGDKGYARLQKGNTLLICNYGGWNVTMV